MKQFLTGIVFTLGMVGLVALWGIGWFTTSLQARNESIVTIVPNTLVTATAVSPPPTTQPQQEAIVIELTAPPSPTNTPLPPTATPTPEPTRPAIEQLPLGEGPYTPEQMQICHDAWAQRLQGELNTHQFGYCKGVVERGQ